MTKFKIGDLVKITNPEMGLVTDHKGEVARWVNVTDSGDGGHIELLSDGQEMCAFNHEVEFYIPQSGDEITLDGTEYILKDRKAEVGEKVIVIERYSCHSVPIGGIIHVNESRERAVTDVPGEMRWLHHAGSLKGEYLTFEKVENKEAPIFEEGDLARVILDVGNTQKIVKGDIVKITDTSDEIYEIERLSDGKKGCAFPHKLELYTPTEGDTLTIKNTDYILRNRKAKIGENVIVIGNGSFHGNEINDIVAITLVHLSTEYVKNEGFGNWMIHDSGEYLVLEPIENNEQSSEEQPTAHFFMIKLKSEASHIVESGFKSTKEFVEKAAYELGGVHFIAHDEIVVALHDVELIVKLKGEQTNERN